MFLLKMSLQIKIVSLLTQFPKISNSLVIKFILLIDKLT